MSFQAIYRSDLKFLDLFYQKRFVISMLGLSRRRIKFVQKFWANALKIMLPNLVVL